VTSEPEEPAISGATYERSALCDRGALAAARVGDQGRRDINIHAALRHIEQPYLHCIPAVRGLKRKPGPNSGATQSYQTIAFSAVQCTVKYNGR
jgi:hypothetical protein